MTTAPSLAPAPNAVSGEATDRILAALQVKAHQPSQHRRDCVDQVAALMQAALVLCGNRPRQAALMLDVAWQSMLASDPQPAGQA